MTHDGRSLRSLRRRLGLTQSELAEALGVDQATVSRWERDIDKPRPSRIVRLQNLLTRDQSNRSLKRQLAIVRANLRPSGIIRDLTIEEMSPQLVVHFVQTRGIDVSCHVGRSLGWHAEAVGNPGFYSLFRDRVLEQKDIVLGRIFVNIAGAGSIVEVEPLHTDGEDQAFLLFQAGLYDAEPSAGIGIDRVDVLPLDAASARLVSVYSAQQGAPGDAAGLHG